MIEFGSFVTGSLSVSNYFAHYFLWSHQILLGEDKVKYCSCCNMLRCIKRITSHTDISPVSSASIDLHSWCTRSLIDSFHWFPPTKRNTKQGFYYFMHWIIDSIPGRSLAFWPSIIDNRILYLSFYMSDNWKNIPQTSFCLHVFKF